jgi:hypothetical protein
MSFILIAATVSAILTANSGCVPVYSVNEAQAARGYRWVGLATVETTGGTHDGYWRFNRQTQNYELVQTGLTARRDLFGTHFFYDPNRKDLFGGDTFVGTMDSSRLPIELRVPREAVTCIETVGQ